MKRLFTSLLMLMALAMATWADQSVGNVNLTNVTYSGYVTPQGLEHGDIYFDYSTNTLTFTDVRFTTSATYAVRSTGTNKLTLIFKGSNQITATYGGISCSGPDLEMYGESSATLNITSEDPSNGYFTPLTVYAKELYIHDLTLMATGHHYGINGGTAGTTPNQSTLKISNAQVTSRITSTTTGDAAMAGFKACTLEKCEPTNGTYYDSAKCGFKAAEGDDFAKAVNIAAEEPFNLWILGKQVTSLNCSNFTVDGLSAGTVSYDNSTKTLTLDGATLTYNESSDQAIRCYFAGLKVNVIGDNTITNTMAVFLITGETTIDGSGTLTLKSEGDCGIYAKQTNLTIKNVTIDATGAWGIAGYNGSTEVLTIDNASIHAAGENGAICDFKTITLSDGLEVLEPVGGQISGGAVVDANGKTAKEALIGVDTSTKYDLYVNENQVTSRNATDILGDGIFSYDEATSTLTIAGDCSSNLEYPIIYNKGVEDLTINVAKESTLAISTFYWIISSEKNFTITGKKLTLKGGAPTAGAIITTNAFLTIKDASIEATENIGAGINASGNTRITIDNSDIVVTTSNYGCMQGWSDIVLKNSYIDQPNPYQILNGCVCDENGDVLGAKSTPETLVIKAGEAPVPYDLVINDTQVTSRNAADILGDGKVTFDAEAGELKLSGSSALTMIENRTKDLKVVVTGENTIENNADYVTLIQSFENISFEGDGTLNLKSTGANSCGMGLYGSYTDSQHTNLSMTLVGPAFNISTANGITSNGSYPILNIYYPSKVVFTGTGTPIKMFASLNLSSLMIVSPDGGRYDSTNRLFVDADGNAYNGPMVIDLQTYDLWIAGTQVSDVNKDDILGDGVFSYVSWYKTLHIAGDYDNTADCRIIESNIEDLIINVDVDSKLTTATDDYLIIYLKANTEIRGGTLTLESSGPDQSNTAIYQEFGDKLTISNASIVIGGGFSYAITGEPNVALEVINSDIVANAHNEGCFKDFGSMTLTDCYIDTPRGAVYKDEALRDADGHIIGSDAMDETVIIKHGTDAINGIDAQDGQTDVYDLAGRRLNNVSRGVNIVRTADSKTQKVLKK